MTDIPRDFPSDSSMDEEQLKALIAKHRVEIDHVVRMHSDEQQKEILKYGFTPEALENYYAELQLKDAELRRREASANKKSVVTGWIAFLGTFTAMALIKPKFFSGGDSKTSVSAGRFIKWATTPFVSLIMGFGSSFIGSTFFDRGIREESKALAAETRAVFEKELAIAIENRERNAAIQSQPKVTQDKAVSSYTSNQQPRGNFVAEVAKEKAAAPTSLQV